MEANLRVLYKKIPAGMDEGQRWEYTQTNDGNQIKMEE